MLVCELFQVRNFAGCLTDQPLRLSGQLSDFRDGKAFKSTVCSLAQFKVNFPRGAGVSRR